MAGPFKLRSGNASAFKNLGSSPAKQVMELSPELKKLKAERIAKTKAGKIIKFGEGSNIIPDKGPIDPWSSDKVDKKAVKKFTKLKEGKGGNILPQNKTLKKATKKAVRKKATKKIAGKVAGKLIPGVGAAITAYDAVKSGANTLHKAKNINMNDPKNAKLAEYKYGTKGKSKNTGKTKQLKSGDKIKATGPED